MTEAGALEQTLKVGWRRLTELVQQHRAAFAITVFGSALVSVLMLLGVQQWLTDSCDREFSAPDNGHVMSKQGSSSVWIVKIHGSNLYKRHLAGDRRLMNLYGKSECDLHIVSSAEFERYEVSTLVRLKGSNQVFNLYLLTVSRGDSSARIGAREDLKLTLEELTNTEYDPGSVFELASEEFYRYWRVPQLEPSSP